jgi:hypothetical protein
MTAFARTQIARLGDSNTVRRHGSRANATFLPPIPIRPISYPFRATRKPVTTRLSLARAYLTSCRRLPLSGGRTLRLHSPFCKPLISIDSYGAVGWGFRAWLKGGRRDAIADGTGNHQRGTR